jgi:hypothetical protein
MKHRVVRLPRKSRDAFGEKTFHPVGDERLGEVFNAVCFRNDLVEFLYLIAYIDLQSIRLKFACSSNGLHFCSLISRGLRGILINFEPNHRRQMVQPQHQSSPVNLSAPS